MIRRLILLIIMAWGAGSAFVLYVCYSNAGQGPTPIAHYADVEPLGGGKMRMTLYAYPKYFKEAGQWKTTVEAFAPGVGDYVAEALQGVHRARVKSDGTVRMEHLDGAIVQRLVGVAAVSKQGVVTKSRAIDLSTWPRVMDGNAVRWTHPDGYTYEVIYSADALVTRWTIPVAQFPVIKAALPGNTVAFGAYTTWDESVLGAGWTCDQPDTVDTEDGIAYLKDGKAVQSLRSARVNAKGPESPGWIKRRIRRKAESLLAELIPVAALDGTEPLVFNDSITYQQGVAGYAGCEDALLYDQQPTYNYGANIRESVGFSNPNLYRTPMRWDVSAVGGAITAATLSLYFENAAQTTVNGQINAFAILTGNTGWVVGTKNGATQNGSICWNKRVYNTTNWAGSVGCGTAGTDHDATELGHGHWIDGAPAWVDLPFDAHGITHIEAWRTGTNDGLLLRANDEATSGYFANFWSADYAVDTSLRPKLAITYTAGGSIIPIIQHHRRQQEKIALPPGFPQGD